MRKPDPAFKFCATKFICKEILVMIFKTLVFYINNVDIWTCKMCNRVNASTIYFLLYIITLLFFFSKTSTEVHTLLMRIPYKTTREKREEKYLRVEFWPEN